MRRSVTRLSLLVTGLLVAAASVATSQALSAQNAGSLPRDLDTILASPELAGADVGLVVRDAKTGEVLYRRDGDRRKQPASNAKLLTSAAALEVLGPDYRFTTSVRTTSDDIAGGVLSGNLYLRGTGDPTILPADYDLLAAKIKEHGIHTVSGELVADDTWFDDVPYPFGWAWDDEPFNYNAELSALTVAPDAGFFTGTVLVRVSPTTAGQPARVETIPPTDHVRIVNTAVTGSASGISIDRPHGSNTITVSGSLAANAQPFQRHRTVSDVTRFTAELFRSALQAHGVKVLGNTVRGATPGNASTLAERQSKPLGELARPFLKLSNNLIAETLVKSMGRAKFNSGTWADGIEAMKSVLPGLGIREPNKLYLEDGSGLSRMDHVAPDQFSDLLIAARGKPWFKTWYNALPVACAEDPADAGTLRGRICTPRATGKVHAKTGSYTGTNALSGYVTGADGRELVFSIISNNLLTETNVSIDDKVASVLAGDPLTVAAKLAPATTRVGVDWCADKKSC